MGGDLYSIVCLPSIHLAQLQSRQETRHGKNAVNNLGKVWFSNIVENFLRFIEQLFVKEAEQI